MGGRDGGRWEGWREMKGIEGEGGMVRDGRGMDGDGRTMLKGIWTCDSENDVSLLLFPDSNSPYNSSYIPGSRSRVVFEKVIGYPKTDYAGKLCRRTINSYSKCV